MTDPDAMPQPPRPNEFFALFSLFPSFAHIDRDSGILYGARGSNVLASRSNPIAFAPGFLTVEVPAAVYRFRDDVPIHAERSGNDSASRNRHTGFAHTQCQAISTVRSLHEYV